MSKDETYIPAMGYFSLASIYDPVMKLAMREKAFKGRLIYQAGFEPGQRVLDLGCGTGTLTLMIKQVYPQVEMVGLDGDKRILEIARRKAIKTGLTVIFDEAMAFAMPYGDGEFDRVVTSLVLHHLTMEQRIETLREILRVLKPGGELHIADFAAPHGQLGHLTSHFFGLFADKNQPGRDTLTGLMAKAGFSEVQDRGRFFTLFGKIGYFSGKKR